MGVEATREHLVLDPRLLGWGNERRVHEVQTRNFEAPAGRKVAKLWNGSFFGWQTPEYEKFMRYLELLHAKGVRTPKGVEILKNPVIELPRAETALKIAAEAWQNVSGVMTIGFVLKWLTQEWWREADYVILEDFSDNPPLTMDAFKDPELAPQLCHLLAVCEDIYKETGIMPDPLGGASISASLRSLVNPIKDPIMSNLSVETDEDGSRHVVLSDFGLMDIDDGERVYEIPGTKWAMALTLAELGHLGFEAMNMTGRACGHKIEPRPFCAGNIATKPFARAGVSTVVAVRKFWEGPGKHLAQSTHEFWESNLGQTLSVLG